MAQARALPVRGQLRNRQACQGVSGVTGTGITALVRWNRCVGTLKQGHYGII